MRRHINGRVRGKPTRQASDAGRLCGIRFMGGREMFLLFFPFSRFSQYGIAGILGEV
jgi:hypothetical protein